MSKERFTSRVAVFAIIRQGAEILLQKRVNTGYKDGFYDLGAAGHLEKSESLQMAMQREIQEELGIDVALADIEFSSIVHKNDTETNLEYINTYFVIKKYGGEPSIMEQEKNAELQWVNINNLPNNLINDRKLALENMVNNVPYSEMGWNHEYQK